jgi:hypothetical protein
VHLGGYWLTRLNSRPDSPAMATFREWVNAEMALEAGPNLPAQP